MTSVLFVVAIAAALAAMGLRRARRVRLRVLAAHREGSAPERAIHVRSYTEIDDHLAARWCACGGHLERMGEGTREAGGRRLRVARFRCQECERLDEVFFDTTDVLH